MQFEIISLLMPCLLILKATGGLFVSYSLQENYLSVKSSGFQLFISIALHFFGFLANLNHILALFLRYFSDSFEIDEIILILSESVFVLQIFAFSILAFRSIKKFAELLNVLIKFETIAMKVNLVVKLTLIEKLCMIIPISACKIIYIYGVLSNIFHEIYVVSSYKWATKIFAINYWLIKISYEVTWWIIAFVVYIFYDKLNKFTAKNISEQVSSSTFDSLRVLFFLLNEAIELMNSLFGLMLLGAFVNSNIMIQYDLHGIQTSAYNYFTQFDVDNSLLKLLVSTRWLFVAVLEVVMQFYICAKIENEVSNFL